MRKTSLHSLILAGLLVSCALPMAGCSQKPPEGISDVQPGPLPEGGDWQGVFYNQRYGFLHITTSGNAVDGAWRNTAGDKWGEMHGEIEGDLLRYSWTEYKIGVVGPNSTSTGKGYFKYVVPAEGNHELKGEWGLGEKDAGNPWDCIKQTNMEPDPKSVRPNDLEGRVGAAGFDGAGGDSEVKDLTTEEEEKKKEGEAKEGEAEGDEKSAKGSKKSKKKGAEE